jgi:hypothetical protein
VILPQPTTSISEAITCSPTTENQYVLVCEICLQLKKRINGSQAIGVASSKSSIFCSRKQID